jgi:hypothetical protein
MCLPSAGAYHDHARVMTVTLLLRRGNWGYRAVVSALSSWLLPEWLRTYARTAGTDSWMASTLLYTAPCTGPACELCHANATTAAPPPSGIHRLTATSAEGVGVRVLIDEVFDKCDAYLAVKLVGVHELDARVVMNDMIGKGYNSTGASPRSPGMSRRQMVPSSARS